MLRYVIINEEKIPQHSLDESFSLEEVKDYPNLAVLIDEPYVVIDIDDSDQALALFNILEKYNVRANIMKTDRGCHFWFKSREPMTNITHSNTPITLKVDVKSWGKKSLVTIKKNNSFREWLVKYDEVDEIPIWLTPIKIKKDLFGLGESAGRDDGLFTYIIPLLKKKFSKKDIETIFNIINKFIFKKPLLQREIDKMFKDNDIFDETLCFYDKREFLHHEFASWMKQNYPIEYFNGQLYLYDKGLYKPDNMKLEELMIHKIPKLRHSQRTEVLRYLNLISFGKTHPPESTLVNCLSGLVNIETNKLMSHTERLFSINQIPTYHNPGTYNEYVDKFLNTISNDDKEIRKLLEELIGYCLLNDCRFQKAFILVGQGANGKSVFLKMLLSFLGVDNVSTITLEELNSRFKTAELVGKLANLGDDISSEFLPDSSIFKKMVSGEKITVERKHDHPFQFSNTAKLVFSANALPPVSDKSYGLHRRLIIIPFLRTFKPGDKDYDPNILNRLTTDEAKMYLFDLAVQGIHRVLKNNSFTNCKKVDELVEEYIYENNNCIQWIETNPEILEIDVVNVYRNYCLYCATNNTKAYKKQRFINEILLKLPHMRIKNTTRNGKFTQVFSEVKKRQ